MNRDLSNMENVRVSQTLTSLTGINFPVEQWPLLNKGLELAAKELGFANKQDFIQMLVSKTLNSKQIDTLTTYITISETYFWREPQVFDAIAMVLQEYVASKNGISKTINIWCAACSTGEEAYSIAIAIHRAIPDRYNWKINIVATDINEKSLNIAKKATYGDWSFRNSPEWLTEKYFTKLSTGKFELIPEIKSMVTFSKLNLIQKNEIHSGYLRSKMDIIFCRNVLMYFTMDWAAKVSHNLYNSLSTNGWLVVASCELSSNLFPMFAPVNFPSAVLYRKPQKELPAAVELLKIEQNLLFLDTFPTGLSEGAAVIFATNNTVTSNQATYFIEEGVSTSKTVTCENIVPKQSVETFNKSLDEKKAFIHKLANQGKLDEALQNCNNTIAVNLLEADLYFIQSTILQELNKNSEAVIALKQAIYINPNFLMCHFTLGNLLIRQGDLKAANLYFNNALDLLKSVSNNGTIEKSEGLSSQQIKEIILSTMQQQVY